MPRPYASFQIDQLEAEFARLQGQGDVTALTHMRDELTAYGRRLSPRVARLITRIDQDLGPLTSEGAATIGDDAELPLDHPEDDQRPATDTVHVRPTRNLQHQERRGRQPAAPKHPPTAEQQEAVRLFQTGDNLKINAYAGTGKTSTLEFLAHSTAAKGLYLAFNKRIVVDAEQRFSQDVTCSTTHSLAYRSLIGRYSSDQLTKPLTVNALVQLLGLKKWRIDQHHVLAPRSQAYLIQSAIRRYCQSDSRVLLTEHVPRHGALVSASPNVIQTVATEILRGAKHVWARMLSPNDALPLGHDGYLKAWALSEPLLPADYILLDEAQDTNPVVLDVLKRQSAQIVYVGDRFQQIYEWRGAVNAMEEAPAVHTAHLTTSFRFGGDIARAANQVLRMLGETRPLVGNPNLNSRMCALEDGTVLARTNATTIVACIDALHSDKRPHLVGGTDDLIKMLRGVHDLKQGQPSAVPDFIGFENWQQVLEFVRSGEGESLLTFVNLVEAHGEQKLLWALNRVVDEGDADVIISTTHKAKGREWDRVRLMDDFIKSLPKRDANGQPSNQADPAELRLLYVALTRARQAMQVPDTMRDFLETGVLPRVAPSDRPVIHVPARNAPPLASVRPPQPPAWTPPPNWQPPVASVPPRVGTASATPQARQALPRPVGKKPGLLRRIFGW